MDDVTRDVGQLTFVVDGNDSLTYNVVNVNVVTLPCVVVVLVGAAEMFSGESRF